MASTNVVRRALPSVNAEGAEASNRGGRYGEQFVLPMHGSRHTLADEGSYFIATNPTFGTPIATTTSIVTYAETAGAVGVTFMIKNSESRTATNPKRIYMDYIKMMIVQVPTLATCWMYGLALDDNPVRYTSGGSLITPVNPNGDSNSASIAITYFGALTTAVPNNRRLVGRGNHRGVIPTTFDEMVIAFGSGEAGGGFASAAASAKYIDFTSPVIIGAQQQLCMSQWGAANTAAPTFEFEIGWWEK